MINLPRVIFCEGEVFRAPVLSRFLFLVGRREGKALVQVFGRTHSLAYGVDLEKGSVTLGRTIRRARSCVSKQMSGTVLRLVVIIDVVSNLWSV